MKKRHKLFVNVEIYLLIENDILKPNFTFVYKFIFVTHFLEDFFNQI